MSRSREAVSHVSVCALWARGMVRTPRSEGGWQPDTLALGKPSWHACGGLVRADAPGRIVGTPPCPNTSSTDDRGRTECSVVTPSTLRAAQNS